MDREDISHWFSNQGSTKPPLIVAISQYLSVQEAVQIFKLFHSNNWIPNGQVLWSGIPRRTAQEWADKHHLQTLTTAMGRLMDENHPDCPRWKKTYQQWSKYIHGASAIFAWHIAQGEKVTVLSPPPPERFHPSGLSSYQVIEEPIIKGLICQSAVDQILMAHPTVTESEDFLYEAWPEDQSSLWLARFGSRGTKRKWRDTGHGADKLRLKQLVVAYSEQRILSIEHTDANHLRKKEMTFTELAFNGLLSLVVLIMLSKYTILLLAGLLYTLVGKIFCRQEIHQYSQSQEMEKYKGRLNMRQEENKTAHSNKISGQIAKANTDTQIKPIKKCKEAVKAWAEAQKATARKLKAERERKAKAKEKEVAPQKLKQEEKEQAKVQKAAAQKLKAERNAQVKAQEKIRQKHKEEQKAQAKAQELEVKRKAQVKAQEKIKQKRKKDQKAQAKAQELITERKKKAKAKEKEVATQKLKQEQKGQAKAQKAAAQKLKAERKAQMKAQEKIKQKRKETQKAQAKAQELKAEKKKKAKAKEKEVATQKLKQAQKEQAKVQKAAAQKLKGQKEAQANKNKARKTVEATKKAKAKIQEWASGKT